MKKVFKTAALLLMFALLPLPALPQAPAATPPAAQEVVPSSAPPAAAVATIPDKFKDSLFLSEIEITLIRQALSGKAAPSSTLKTDPAALPAHHIIELSGIVYNAPQDWIIWVNGEKVTPKKMLPQIVDISVHNSSLVSMKWFDGRSVVPVTMRPRQVYDTVTHVTTTAGR